VFSPDQEVIEFESLTDGRECSVILEFSGMWFAKKAFGPTFNLVQLKLHPEPIKSEYPEEYAFVEEEEDPEEEEVVQAPVEEEEEVPPPQEEIIAPQE
jgi:hypothetical protein